jgi:hypothetical protein
MHQKREKPAPDGDRVGIRLAGGAGTCANVPKTGASTSAEAYEVVASTGTEIVSRPALLHGAVDKQMPAVVCVVAIV